MPEKTFSRLPTPTESREPDSDFRSQEEALRPLERLRQLAVEIQAALARNNMELVHQATALLPSALARWEVAQRHLHVRAPEIAQMAQETRALLDTCEADLMQRRRQVGQKMRRLQQGRRAIALVRTRHASPISSRQIDLKR